MIPAKPFSLLLLSVLMLAGCASPFESEETQLDPQTLHSVKRYKKVYTLGVSDVIEVLVQRNPVASRTVTIRSDGYISLPLIGDFKAEGLTFDELAKALTEEYGKRLKDPEVNILGVDLRAPMIYVVGEVNAPRPVGLREAHTAAQAVAACGGFRPSAARGAVAVIRLEDDGRLSATPLSRGSGSQPAPYLALQTFTLRADDILFVPESGRSQFGKIVDDFINKPLSGVNSILTGWANYRLIEALEDE